MECKMHHLERKKSHKDLVEKFYELVIELKPDYFIEVGAYEATASTEISKNLPETSCVAYEANKYNYNHFKPKMHKSKNFKYLNTAVSNYDGFATFHIQANRNRIIANNSLHERMKEGVPYEKVMVQCSKIDTVYTDLSKSYCFWIDAEGHGLEVLEGAKTILKNTKYIFIEVENKKFWKNQKIDKHVIKYLEKQGFKILQRDYQYEEQYNILFERIL
tara:strand:- start:194 stop:847 length:654 start_codon:yes stop_codon:yes gene_type:complete